MEMDIRWYQKILFIIYMGTETFVSIQQTLNMYTESQEEEKNQ